MSSIADTACQRCRRQKLRCSHELPDCARCVRFGATCYYPPPPDRKILARQRAPAKARSTVKHERYGANGHDSRHDNPRTNSDSAANKNGSEDVFDGDIQDISAPVQTLLCDIYFSCQFHSALLFHRGTFDEALQAGHEPDHTLLAMFATATIFLPPESRLYKRHANTLRPLGNLRALGQRFATAAARECLQAVDQPTFASVRTCEMLSLYFFSQGDFQRNVMHLSIAHKAAVILGLDGDDPERCFENMNSTYKALPLWLKKEMGRRLYWAVWYTQCINSDHSLTDLNLSDNIMKLALPCAEVAYAQVTQDAVTALPTISIVSSSERQDRSTNSVFAELIVAMYFWARVRLFLDARSKMKMSEWLPVMFSLDSQLTEWYAAMPEYFAYTKRQLYQQRLQSVPSLYLFIHTVYHQCRLVLHSSLVPQFSGLRLPKNTSKEIVQISARVAIKAAQDIVQMATDLVALDWEVAQLPAFFGYAMYSSASIQIAMLQSEDKMQKSNAKTGLRVNLRWLRSLQSTWSNLERLWIRINVLYEAHVKRMQAVETGHPTGASVGSSLRDIDELAQEVRDAGELAEPLADSILEYSLQRLRPSAAFTSQAMQELEDNIDFDRLQTFIEENSPNDPQPLLDTDALMYDDPSISEQTRTNSFGVQAYPTAVDPLPAQMEHWLTVPYPIDDQLQSYNWWGIGTDLLEPVLPYEDLLANFGNTT